MEIFEAIKGRRSIRKYKPQPIPDEAVEKILEAGRWAPSGGNIQPWKFIVVKDPATLEMIRKVSPGYLGIAPLAIVVCSDKQRAFQAGGRLGRDYMTIADCAMAVQNMLLAAYALGLGTCVVKSFSPIAVKEILEIPDGIEPELIVVVGYPDERPAVPHRFSVEEITYLDKYGNKFVRKGP
ncbi:MAG: nitroreductase family protein [Hadesarchaea archaeon]|nr:nitroreductase family protein [Hadesarchaea archaeon]